jgi:hypothetical protein
MIKKIIKKIKQLFCSCKTFIAIKVEDVYIRVCAVCGKEVKR